MIHPTIQKLCDLSYLYCIFCFDVYCIVLILLYCIIKQREPKRKTKQSKKEGTSTAAYNTRLLLPAPGVISLKSKSKQNPSHHIDPAHTICTTSIYITYIHDTSRHIYC